MRSRSLGFINVSMIPTISASRVSFLMCFYLPRSPLMWHVTMFIPFSQFFSEFFSFSHRDFLAMGLAYCCWLVHFWYLCSPSHSSSNMLPVWLSSRSDSAIRFFLTFVQTSFSMFSSAPLNNHFGCFQSVGLCAASVALCMVFCLPQYLFIHFLSFLPSVRTISWQISSTSASFRIPFVFVFLLDFFIFFHDSPFIFLF